MSKELSVKKCLEIARICQCRVSVVYVGSRDAYLTLYDPLFESSYHFPLYSCIRSASYVDNVVMDYFRRKYDEEV